MNKSNINRYNIGDVATITEDCIKRMINSNHSSVTAGYPSDSFITSAKSCVGLEGVVSHVFPPGYEVTIQFPGNIAFHIKDNWIKPVIQRESDDLNLVRVVGKMMREISDDVLSGVIDNSRVASFKDLHDFVDANEYGGFCKTETMIKLEAQEGGFEGAIAFINEAQVIVNDWIQKGSGIKYLNSEKQASKSKGMKI